MGTSQQQRRRWGQDGAPLRPHQQHCYLHGDYTSSSLRCSFSPFFSGSEICGSFCSLPTSSKFSAAIWPTAKGKAKQHTHASLTISPVIPSLLRVATRKPATASPC